MCGHSIHGLSLKTRDDKKKRGGYFRLKKKLKKHWKVTYNHSLESR